MPTTEQVLKQKILSDTALPHIKTDQHGQNWIDVKVVDIGKDRGRKGAVGIQELADTIREVGLINPIRLRKMGDKYELVAGFRRTMAFLTMGERFIPFTLQDEDNVVAKKVELYENVFRKELDMTEEAILHSQIHERMLAKYGQHVQGDTSQPSTGWTVKKTAEVFGEDASWAKKKIELGTRIRKDPSIRKRIAGLPVSAALQELAKDDQRRTFKADLAAGTITVKVENVKTDCLSGIRSIPDKSINMLLTDPPFGNSTILDTSGQVRTNNTYTSLMRPTDNMSAESVTSLMVELIPELARVLVPGSHFYIFFCWELYQPLTDLLKKHEFLLEPCPLIWYKERNVTPSMGYNFCRSYEPILYGHFKERTKRLSGERNWDVLSYAPVPQKERLHVFHKPSKLLQQLILASTLPGETILDPFSGSAEVLKQAKNLNRNAIGFECDEDNWVSGQMNLSSKPVQLA